MIAANVDLSRSALIPPNRSILEGESSWRAAYDGGKFATQLALDNWRPRNNEAPELEAKGISQFFLVDGPVRPEDALAVEGELEGPPQLEKPRVIFTYTNWDPASPSWAYEYKEAAYTVLEGYENSAQGVDFEAIDCDEPAAHRFLCSHPCTGNRTPPGLFVFHTDGPSGSRTESVCDLQAIRASSGPAQWAAATKLAAWLRDEIEAHSDVENAIAGDDGESDHVEDGGSGGGIDGGVATDGDSGAVMDAGRADVDASPASAYAGSGVMGDTRDGDDSGYRQDSEGEGYALGEHTDVFDGLSGGDASDDDIAWAPGDGTVVTEEEGAVHPSMAAAAAGVLGAHSPSSSPLYTSENGDFGTPAPSLSSARAYSFTPDAAPDPGYEGGAPEEDDDEESEEADYHERRRAWEAAGGEEAEDTAVDFDDDAGGSESDQSGDGEGGDGSDDSDELVEVGVRAGGPAVFDG